RVEDGRAVLAGTGRHRLARGADLGAYLVERTRQLLPLRLRVVRRAGRNLRIQDAEVAGGRGHDSGGAGKAVERLPVAVLGSGNRRGRRGGRGLLLGEVAPSGIRGRGERGRRPRPGRRDGGLVPPADAGPGPPGEAAPARRAAA